MCRGKLGTNEVTRYSKLSTQKKLQGGAGIRNSSAINTMTTTLPLFWDLSSASKKDRINASVKLVGALEQFQARFVPQTPAPGTSGSDEDEDEEEDEGALKSDELNLLNAQDVSYSIRRLIRGLASPRESSRLGFAVALTEVSYERKIYDGLNSPIYLASIAYRHSHLFPNLEFNIREYQTPRIDVWSRRTRRSFCPSVWNHVGDTIRACCANRTPSYLGVVRSSSIDFTKLRTYNCSTPRIGRPEIMATRKRLVCHKPGR